MEQKAKIIIIALIAILALSFFLTFQAYISKQTIARERDALRIDNESLAKKASEALSQGQQMQKRINALSADLDLLTKEKEEIQTKFDLINKEKADLVQQVKVLKSRRIETAQVLSVPISQPVEPQATDEYWAGILKAKTELEIQIQNIRQQLKNLQINNEQLQKDKNSLLLEANNLDRERVDLTRQLEYNQKMMDSIAAELVREKNDKFQIDSNAKTIKDENKFLRRQLKALNNHKIDLERRLADLQDKNSTLNRRLDEMETMLKQRLFKTEALKKDMQLEEKAKPLETEKESVELTPIVVRPQKVSVSSEEIAGLIGKVLAVNRENNFIIVDLGEDSGVKIGNIFTVYRQDQPVAEVVVIQTRKDISACEIKKENTPIQLGDTIR
jgi:chromosome segregation ATPase